MNNQTVIAIVAIGISIVTVLLVLYTQFNLTAQQVDLDIAVSENAKRMEGIEQAINDTSSQYAQINMTTSSLEAELMTLKADLFAYDQRIRLVEGRAPSDNIESFLPVAVWTFDESLNPVHDLTGNGNDGLLNGQPKWISENNCLIGSCLQFDGEDDYLFVADSKYLDLTSEGTITGWIKIDESPNVWGQVIGKRTTGFASGHSYILDLSHTGNNLRGLISDGVIDNIVTGKSSLVPSIWHHVAFAWDGSSLKIYLNGNLDASSVQTVDAFSNSFPVEIGKGSDPPPVGGVYFKGSIDELKVFNRALYAAEIQSLYRQDN